jgi:hypothetical protein
MSFQVNLATSTPANPTYLLMAHGQRGSGTTLQEHTSGNRIYVGAEFVTGQVAGNSGVARIDRKSKIHGSLNILGWGLLLPVGAMVARYARALDPCWFYTHIAFQVVGFACVIAGVATGVDIAKYRMPDQLDAHRGLGIFIFVLAILQVLALGLRPKVDAKVRKYWNWYHHWVGRLALFLAVINIFLGLNMSHAERDFKVGYISILSIELAAFVILELLLWLRWNRQRPSPDPASSQDDFHFGGNV